MLVDLVENERASRVYANCLLLYEKVAHKEQEDIYLPKCLCILSKHPFFETFKQVLSFLYSTYISNGLDEAESIERILDNFMFEVPVSTSPAAQVLFKIGAEVQKLSVSPFLPDYPLDPLFHVLSPDNVLKIMGWMCTERTIIFVSEHAYLLGLVIQTFLWLLQPLKWCHACIAILPPDFEYLLHCPQPLLVGVCGADLKTTFGKGDDVVAVYLDDNQIVSTLDKDLFPIPGRLAAPMKKSVKDLASKKSLNSNKEDIAKLGKAFHYRTISDRGSIELLSVTPVKKTAGTLDPLKVKDCFVPFVKELVGNYSQYLKDPDDTEEPKEQGKVFEQRVFDYKAYFTARDGKDSMFFEKFSKTQLFEQYGEELNNATAAEQYLIEIVDKFQEGKPLPITRESLIQESVTATDPDYRIGKKSMLIKHVLNKCETFPSKLNNSLFLNIQAISWDSITLTHDPKSSVKQNPLRTLPPIESLLHLSFATSFVEYFRKNEGRLKRFWQIVKTQKSGQYNSGSRSYSSRNNNKTRSINVNGCAGVIDTSSCCTYCGKVHSLWDVRKKMYNNKELYVTCDKCSKTFIPHFCIQRKYYNKKYRQDLQQEYLNPSILLAVIEETQKSPGSSMANGYFYEHCPVIFWNLLILFSDLRLELNHHSDTEVALCTVHDYMHREEEEQEDPFEPELAARSKEEKLKRRPQFNATNFLTVHTNAQKKVAPHRHSLKRCRGAGGTKVINIDLSRKVVKLLSQGVSNTPSMAKLSSVDDKLAATLSSAEEGAIEKNIQSFSTRGRRKVSVNKAATTEAASKGSSLLRDVARYWNFDYQRKGPNKDAKNEVNLYDKYISSQLEDLRVEEEETDKRNNLRTAQQFLSRIMKLLLLKVSCTSDKNLMDIQNYIISNKLLEN